jgi:hypothetical protein
MTTIPTDTVAMSLKDFGELATFIENETDMAVHITDRALYAYRRPCTWAVVEGMERATGQIAGAVQDMPGLVLALPIEHL